VTFAAGAARVTVSGELDIATVPPLDEALRRAAAAAYLVTLDLTGLEFTDSSGADLLLAAHRRIRGGNGRLLILRGAPEVDWLLALLGVDKQLELVGPSTASPGLAVAA
jgi:anti-anti-sigma factor